MQDKLFIYLHADDLTNPSWATGSYSHRGEVESLRQIASERTVIVIVPPEDVLLITAKLPKMNRSKLLQALPFALEEQLIADVDTLHFAAGEYQTDGSLPVAVVAHEKMRLWLDLLKSWGIVADALIPLTLAIPYTNNTRHVFLYNEMTVVRSGTYSGYACDRNNFSQLQEIVAVTAQPSNDDILELIHLHNYTQQACAETLKVSAQIKEDFEKPENMLDNLTQSLNPVPALNLLQQSYAIRKSKLPKLKLSWKIAAYLASAWIFLLFLYPCISYLMLKHKITTIDHEIAQIYRQNFPQATSIVAPKLRMQEKLQNLATQTGENRALVLLGLIGKGMTEKASVKVKRFDFQNNQASLELSAATSEGFSTFTDYLSQQGLSVKQQNADIASGKINATLQIE